MIHWESSGVQLDRALFLAFPDGGLSLLKKVKKSPVGGKVSAVYEM